MARGVPAEGLRRPRHRHLHINAGDGHRRRLGGRDRPDRCPLCSATVPGCSYCPHESTATVKVEDPTGISLLAWRCRDHIPAMVDATVKSCRDATITITPLAATEPPPEPDSEAIQPLHLVTG